MDNQSQSDELYHWKYVKRVRVNGKWRYYYDLKDALGYDERQAMNDANNQYRVAKGRENTALDNYHGYTKYLGDKYYRSPHIDSRTGALKPAAQQGYDEESKKLKPLYAEYQQKQKEAAAAGRKFTEAREKYTKTPLYKVEKAKSTIDKGRKAVSKFLKELAGRFD